MGLYESKVHFRIYFYLMKAFKKITTWLWGCCIGGSMHAQYDSGFMDKLVQNELNRYEGLRKSGAASHSSMADFDVHFQRLELEVNPSVMYIKGAVTTHFKALKDSLQQVAFDLRINLMIDSIKNGQGQSLSFQRISHVFLVDLAAPVLLNQSDSLTVYYKGAPINTGLGSVGRQTYSWGSAFWTLSQPYGARDWWPCKDGLQDKIDSMDVVLISPQGTRGASVGTLVSEQVINNQNIAHWQHRYPVATYLVAIAVAHYKVYEQSILLPTLQKNLPFVNYVYPPDSLSSYTQNLYTHQVMQLLDTLFISYPFHAEKYGHAQFGWGGGMEHQTMSFMGNFSEDLITHELAHQWFGDLVTCGTWSDLWLNEGFAMYLTQLTYEYLKSPQQNQNYKIAEIARITQQPGGSVFTLDTINLNRLFNARLTYSKAGYILHTLRWIVGDSAFYAGCQNFLNDPALRFSFAKTADLKSHMEASCQCNLTAFFDQWVFGQGYPSYQIIWNQVGDSVVFNVSQSQSHSSVSLFTTPMPLQVIDSNGQNFHLRIDQIPSNQFQKAFFMPSGAAQVLLDPEKYIISKSNIVLSQREFERLRPDFKVFPNPGNGDVKLQINPLETEVLQIEVYNALGQKVWETKDSRDFVLEKGILELPLKHLARGSYWIQISKNQIIGTQIWIKN